MTPTSMNLSSDGKHSMKSFLTAISLALAFVPPAFAGIEWGFNSSVTSVGASVGSGTAKIQTGSFNTGWHDGTSIPWTLGSVPGAQGFWDLGNAGSIMLSGFSLSGPVTLTVFQWVDSGPNNGPYSGDLSFSASNGSLGDLAPLREIASSGLTGAWWEYTADLGTLALGDSVTVIAPGGAIIDRLNLTLVPEPATLIAGAILLIPFALSTWPLLRRRRTS
jgi:hypothetical protein